ncbi:MAG: LCP family protein [Trueperaceae bacterium]|nr:LCP family protein [Trueperaceae bacterium]
MKRRDSRLIALLGVLVALGGLAGYWLSRDIQRATLSRDQRELLGLSEDDFHVSMIVAGRDIFSAFDSSDPIYAQDGTIIGWVPNNYVTHTAGTQTDTILYVDIQGDDIAIVALPRDLWVEDLGYKINAAYHLGGAEGLKRRAEAVIGVPIDYYLIVKLDIFQNLVDALGGVDIVVPYDMRYRDNAAGLDINFRAGPMHMDGVDASKFIRYRNSLRGDIDRLDNVKRLAYAMLQRVKELNVRAVTLVPSLVDTFLSDVETNVSPALVRQLASRVGNLDLRVTATLPVEEGHNRAGSIVLHDPRVVNEFMAATFGGVAREFAEAPELDMLITDRSGTPGLGEWYMNRLIALGVPEERLMLRTFAEADTSGTRILATLATWEGADYYADLLHASKQQVDRFQPYQRRAVELELVLGTDAAQRASFGPGVIAAAELP